MKVKNGQRSPIAGFRTLSFKLPFALVSVVVVAVILFASTALWQWDFFALKRYDTILELSQIPVGAPVLLQGVVTYSDPSAKRFWIQDDTGAIAINGDPRNYGLRGGESIKLIGTKALVSSALTGATSVTVTNIRIVSTRSRFKLPAPAAASLRTLPVNERTGVRVQLTGVVRQIRRDSFGAVQLAFGDAEQEIPATLSVFPDDTPQWLNARIRVVGVAESYFDDNGRPKYQHVWIQRREDVQVLDSGTPPEPVSIRTLYRDSSSRDGHDVQMHGRVTAYLGEASLLLTDRWGAIACQFDEPQTISVGTSIDVSGFPTTDGLRISLLHSSASDIQRQQVRDESRNEVLPELTTVASIRTLDEKRARAALPVKVTGVITYIDTSWRQVFFQDSTGGIYVKYAGSTGLLARGQRVTITGITGAGGYAPVISAPTFVVLGKGKLPEPIVATIRDASSGKLDSQYVEVEGVIHPMKVGEDAQHSRFELYSTFGQVQVFTGPSFLKTKNFQAMEDATVRIRGVLGTVFNSNRQLAGYQLSVTSSNDIKVLEPAELNPFGKVASPVSSLLRFSPHTGFIHRVKVRGAVTMVGKGFFYLQDEDGGLQVLTDSQGLQLSDVVEAVGYPTPSGSYSPALTDAVVRVIGHGAAVSPRPLTAESALQGQFDSRLGTIDARLLSIADTINGKALVMRSGVLTFNAQFDGVDPSTPLPALQEGSLLRLTGICSIQVDPGKLYLLLVQEPLGFRLLIRSPRDIKILKPPVWWSTSHALVIFGLLLMTICVVLGWVTILRRRVTKQVQALKEASDKASAIRNLTHAMQEVTIKGDFDEKVSIGGNDEIAQLGMQFNTMLLELQVRDQSKKEAEARLQYQALTDELTGLPNRRLLSDRLSQTLAIAKREHQILAVLYIDLDGFKLVNDSLGHTIGDMLLGQVAERLQSRVRKSDTLARIGGDEFTMVLASLHDKGEAELVARNLLEVLARPFFIEEHEIVISASVGISAFPDHGATADDLLQHADSAMYAAKRNGKNQVTYFTTEIGSSVRERSSLEHELRGAIARGEITVHYQPEFDVGSGQLIRFEALARWTHPTLGTIPPSKFIPIAEESGLIVPFGAYIMKCACEEAVKWQVISDHPIQVAVNVSSLQFMRDTFVLEISEILQRARLDPKLLQIELTESVMLTGTERASIVMKELHALGLTLAIDDFGTGYSCFSYLPRLPFDALKIDRSFVKELELRPETKAMVHSLITLAHNLKMQVIVEGIETHEQLKMVENLGGNEVQGFLLGRPTADPQSEIRMRQNSRGLEKRDNTYAE
jgi:diguanylate cyclase (GGDEF)-like protein